MAKPKPKKPNQTKPNGYAVDAEACTSQFLGTHRGNAKRFRMGGREGGLEGGAHVV